MFLTRGGGGGGRFRPKWVPQLIRLQTYENVGSSLVEVYNSVTLVSKKGPKGLTGAFYGCEQVVKLFETVHLAVFKS